MLTVIIPVAPHHDALLERARASCAAQTVPVEVIAVRDTERRGAAWARNRGLEQVTTPFVTFLDADDLLEPEFAAATLRAYDGRCYVYTDWYQDDEHVRAPDCAWRGGTWHIITALVPTAWARAVGGFDETLPGAEDTDFWLKLRTNGMCGRRLAVPLVHYTKDGARSKAFVESAAFEAVMRAIDVKYRGKAMGACCGEYTPEDQPILGDRESGDVLAVALWGGNRRERGRATGRFYQRAGNGAQMWVDPADVAAAPHLWMRVVAPEAPPVVPDDEFAALAAIAFGGAVKPAPVPARRAPLATDIKPDILHVMEMYRQAVRRDE